MIKLLAGLLVTLSLVACGGGGGSAPSGGNGTNPPSGGTNPPTGGNNPPSGGGTATAVLYEGVLTPSNISRANLLSQLNAQGARGFSYYSPNIAGNDVFNFYAKDSSTTFSYEILDLPNSSNDLSSQLNSQGARGFALYGPSTQGMIFGKESANATYSYRTFLSATTTAAFLTQINAQGSEGYVYVGSYVPDTNSGTAYSAFEKINNTNSVYSYRTLTMADTEAALISQINQQGAEGYKYTGAQFVNSFFNLYVKDTSQNATFAWKVMPLSTSMNALVTQANTEGSQGNVFWATIILVNDNNKELQLYFKPSNCSGTICRASSPL